MVLYYPARKCSFRFLRVNPLILEPNLRFTQNEGLTQTDLSKSDFFICAV